MRLAKAYVGDTNNRSIDMSGIINNNKGSYEATMSISFHLQIGLGWMLDLSWEDDN